MTQEKTIQEDQKVLALKRKKNVDLQSCDLKRENRGSYREGYTEFCLRLKRYKIV